MRAKAIIMPLLCFALFNIALLSDALITAGFLYSWSAAWAVLLSLLVIILLQSLVLFFLQKKFIGYIFIAIFTSGNIFSYKLTTYDYFAESNFFTLLIIYFSLVLVIYIWLKYSKLYNLKWNAYILTLFVSLVSINTFYNNKQTLADNGLDYFKNVKLKSTPNIYVFSFDSMTSSSFQNKWMGRDMPYQEVLSKFYDNYSAFSLAVPSVHSLNALYRFDMKSFDGKELHSLNYYSGNKESPLSSLLKANDYRINSGYFDDSFGLKGNFIDEYTVGSQTWYLPAFAFCQVVPPNQKYVRYYGMCNRSNIINKVLGKYARDPISLSWPMEIIDGAIKVDTFPKFTYFYFYYPLGHTTPGFNPETDTEKYLQQYYDQSNNLSVLLNHISDKVKARDPNAIVIIFGDHGPYLTRNMDCKRDVKFCIADRFGVNLSILKTENNCSKILKLKITNEIVTPSKALVNIFNCLSETVFLKSPPDVVEISPGDYRQLTDYIY